MEHREMRIAIPLRGRKNWVGLRNGQQEMLCPKVAIFKRRALHDREIDEVLGLGAQRHLDGWKMKRFQQLNGSSSGHREPKIGLD